MKIQHVVGLTVLSLLVACGSGETKSHKKEEKPKVEVEQWHDVVGEYETFVKKLKNGPARNSSIAMKKFKELFKDADKATCDSGFVVFHELYEGLIENINGEVYTDEVLQNTVWNQMDENGKSEPMPKAFKDLEKKVKPHGYRLEFPEGMISVGYDRSFIAKNFYKYVSPEMRRFLKQLDKENDEQFGADGGIAIDETEFVDRLIWWEKFEVSYPAFILKARVKATRAQLFSFFMTGSDNTPVYWPVEENPIEISEYFTNAYGYLEKKYPKSITWKRTKPYREALLNNNMVQVENLKKQYTKKGWMYDFSKSGDIYI